MMRDFLDVVLIEQSKTNKQKMELYLIWRDTPGEINTAICLNRSVSSKVIFVNRHCIIC